MKVFGGTIGWKANKQATVTTSSTEAELLALAQATKEGIFVNYLLKELNVKLDEGLTVECDNLQTLRLVTREGARLTTKLRHVDIHNHWLRQEVQEGRLQVYYTPTKEMIADGLTKALSGPKHAEFVRQMGLVDIETRILESRNRMKLEQRLLEKRRAQETASNLNTKEIKDMAKITYREKGNSGGVC
jgi:hypothetical protein